MSRLIRLPNGDYVAPANVRAIRKLPVSFCTINSEVHEPRFVVDLANGNCIIVVCADADAVNAGADALAAAIEESP